VAERLLAHGFTDIRCMLRDQGKAARLKTIAERFPAAHVECISGNLGSRADCARAVAQVSLVIHLAAGMKGPAADLFLNSVVASNNLLAALAARPDPPEKTRVVLISSFGVYGVARLPRRALVNEDAPLESNPELRDVYSYSKLRQELLFREWAAKEHFELVVLRPGVIYGPGGGHMSTRVGLQAGSLYLHLGGRNLLPLSYVENCAEAIALAAMHPDTANQVYNVHDDQLISCAQFLRQYKKNVKRLRSVRIPYYLMLFLSSLLERYRRRSSGQIPSILTPYKVASSWKGNRFSNLKLHSIGWKQIVSTPEALDITFKSLREAAK
jgi:nucleoside-diphosphate-sugar epimerase